MGDTLSIADYAFASCVLMSFSGEETLFRGRWTCPLVSKDHPLVWRCRLSLRNLYIYIIIMMSHRQRGYPWPSLAISPYHSSPPVGLQGYILCPHIVAVCKFVLVVLLLHIHMWGSTGVHRLWARPCFSSSVPRVWFVWLVYIYIYIYIYIEREREGTVGGLVGWVLWHINLWR